MNEFVCWMKDCHRLILSLSYYVEIYINDKLIYIKAVNSLWFVFRTRHIYTRGSPGPGMQHRKHRL
jgi:hypothetical protein